MNTERINDLLNRYELGAELMTAYDVANELQDILDDENRTDKLMRKLQRAIDDYADARHDYNRYAGHTNEGGDDFIERVERLVGWGCPLFLAERPAFSYTNYCMYK